MTCFSVDLLTGRGNKYILYSNLLTPDGITIQADQMPNGLPTLQPEASSKHSPSSSLPQMHEVVVKRTSRRKCLACRPAQTTPISTISQALMTIERRDDLCSVRRKLDDLEAIVHAAE